MIMKTKANLISEAFDAGFITEAEGENWMTWTKEEIMDEIATHYVGMGNRDIQQVPVMLAKSIYDLKENRFAQLLRNSNYVLEPKLDGCRARLHFTEKEIQVTSRNRSVKTYRYNDKTDNFPWLRDNPLPDYVGTVLDCEVMAPVKEIVHGQTQTTTVLTAATSMFNSDPERSIELQLAIGHMKFSMFDIPFLRGADLRKEPLYRRRLILTNVAEMILEQHPAAEICLSLIPQWPNTEDAAQGLFTHLTQSGAAEGLMFKDKNSLYADTPNSRTSAWHKWKRFHELDAYIVGSEPGTETGKYRGLVGALKLAVVDERGKEHEIAAVIPGSDQLRFRMTRPDGTLGSVWYGKVVEVSYQEWTKFKRLRHATIIRWRPDKTPEDCQYVFGTTD